MSPQRDMAEERETLTQNFHRYTTEDAHYSSCSQDTSSRDRQGSIESNDLSPNEKRGNLQTKQLVWGCLSGLFGALGWAISASCAQALGGIVPAFELNCFRFGVPLLIAIPTILYLRPSVHFTKEQTICLIIHGVSLSLSNLAYYEAAIYIPVGMLGGLESSLLIVATFILVMALGEKCSIPIPVSIVLSVSGIIFLTQPAFVFKYFGPVKELHTTPVCVVKVIPIISVFNTTTVLPENNTTNVTAQLHEGSSILTDQIKGLGLAVVSTIFYTIAIGVQTRYLKDLSASVIMFAMSAVGVMSSALAMLCLETPTFPAESKCAFLLAGHAMAAGAASFLGVVTVAFTSGFIYSLLLHLQLFFFFVAQYTALKSVNPGYGNWEEIVGAMLVFAAGLFGPCYTLLKQLRLKEDKKPRDDELGMEDR